MDWDGVIIYGTLAVLSGGCYAVGLLLPPVYGISERAVLRYELTGAAA